MAVQLKRKQAQKAWIPDMPRIGMKRQGLEYSSSSTSPGSASGGPLSTLLGAHKLTETEQNIPETGISYKTYEAKHPFWDALTGGSAGNLANLQNMQTQDYLLKESLGEQRTNERLKQQYENELEIQRQKTDSEDQARAAAYDAVYGGKQPTDVKGKAGVVQYGNAANLAAEGAGKAIQGLRLAQFLTQHPELNPGEKEMLADIALNTYKQAKAESDTRLLPSEEESKRATNQKVAAEANAALPLAGKAVTAKQGADIAGDTLKTTQAGLENAAYLQNPDFYLQEIAKKKRDFSGIPTGIAFPPGTVPPNFQMITPPASETTGMTIKPSGEIQGAGSTRVPPKLVNIDGGASGAGGLPSNSNAQTGRIKIPAGKLQQFGANPTPATTGTPEASLLQGATSQQQEELKKLLKYSMGFRLGAPDENDSSLNY